MKRFLLLACLLVAPRLGAEPITIDPVSLMTPMARITVQWFSASAHAYSFNRSINVDRGAIFIAGCIPPGGFATSSVYQFDVMVGLLPAGMWRVHYIQWLCYPNYEFDAREVATTSFTLAAPLPSGAAVEYFRSSVGPFFLATDRAEAEWLDDDPLGWKWMRTGYAFKVWNAPAPGLVPVCRFLGNGAAGGPTEDHFYTAFPEECGALRENPLWIDEGIAFHAMLPNASGACLLETIPVHRAWNRPGLVRDVRHRFSETLSVLEGLVRDHGWQYEGIAYCVPP